MWWDKDRIRPLFVSWSSCPMASLPLCLFFPWEIVPSRCQTLSPSSSKAARGKRKRNRSKKKRKRHHLLPHFELSLHLSDPPTQRTREFSRKWPFCAIFREREKNRSCRAFSWNCCSRGKRGQVTNLENDVLGCSVDGEVNRDSSQIEMYGYTSSFSGPYVPNYIMRHVCGWCGYEWERPLVYFLFCGVARAYP